jgi:lipopolysaccharide O-acetyltransferase
MKIAQSVRRSLLGRSVEEDGLYVVAMRRLEAACSCLRNYCIARKLGVSRIRIGPRPNLRGLSSIEMGDDFVALEGLWLHAVTQYYDQQFSPRIVIGNRVRVSQWVHIAATHYVEIGDDVLIGSKVVITDHNHGQYSLQHTSPDIPPSLRPLDCDRSTTIGANAWLGDSVAVAPGASIGKGSIVGANSVVVGEIPPFSLAAGVPARVIKAFDFDTQQWKSVEQFGMHLQDPPVRL